MYSNGQILRDPGCWCMSQPCLKCVKEPALDRCEDCWYGNLKQYYNNLKSQQNTYDSLTVDNVITPHILNNKVAFNYFQVYQMTNVKLPKNIMMLIQYYITLTTSAMDTRNYLINTSDKYKWIGVIHKRNNHLNHEYLLLNKKMDVWRCEICKMLFVFKSGWQSIVDDACHKSFRMDHNKICKN